MLTNTKESYEYFKNLLSGKLTEEIYVACLTPKRKIVTLQKVAEGNSKEVSITVRAISDIVSSAKVHNVVIAHNHPGGSSTPSQEDDIFTQVLAAAFALTETMLLDHIIIGENGDWYSYWLSGKIQKYIEPYMAVLKKSEKQGKVGFFEQGDSSDKK